MERERNTRVIFLSSGEPNFMSHALLHSFALLSCGKSWETTQLLTIVDGLNDDSMRSFTWSYIEYSHLTVSLTWVFPSTNVEATERSIFSPQNVRFLKWYCPLPEGAKKKHHKTKQITSCNVSQHPKVKRRRESKISTGWFPKQAPKAQAFRWEVWSVLPGENFWISSN